MTGTKKDEDGNYLVDVILDEAANKGTGKWTSQSALDLGEPLSLITESVFARYISSLKDQRVAASKVLSGPQAQPAGDKTESAMPGNTTDMLKHLQDFRLGDTVDPATGQVVTQ